MRNTAHSVLETSSSVYGLSVLAGRQGWGMDGGVGGGQNQRSDVTPGLTCPTEGPAQSKGPQDSVLRMVQKLSGEELHVPRSCLLNSFSSLRYFSGK